MRSFLLILMVLAMSSCSSQGPLSEEEKAEGVKWFKRGNKLNKSERYEKARNFYKRLIDTYPQHELYPKALYNLGYSYLQEEMDEQAIPYFQKLLKEEIPERDSGGPGRGIMAEPFALYKHRSCERLAEIHYRKENYEKALKYMGKADTVHPYQHFCGNAHAANEVRVRTFYAKCYRKLGKPEKGIQRLLPYAFGSRLTSTDSLASELANSLEATYSRKRIEEEFREALEEQETRIDSHMTVADTSSTLDTSYIPYCKGRIEFFGDTITETRIIFERDDEPPMKERCSTRYKKLVRGSALYSKLDIGDLEEDDR